MAIKLGDFFPSLNPINEPGLDLYSPIWQKLEGGYKIKYDGSVALKKLEKVTDIKSVEAIYKVLWGELHHQGDVGLASYYAVPHLVRIAKQTGLFDQNIFGLISTIGVCRFNNNPQVPKALVPQYDQALVELVKLAEEHIPGLWDLDLTGSVLTIIALNKGQNKLAAAIFELDADDRIDEFLTNY